MKIRWGIAGLGNVAKRFALDLVNEVENGELVAVASNSMNSAVPFANTYDCEAEGGYEELAKRKDIDAIYIANIHPMHFNSAMLFLEHGKHVLIEKPAVTTCERWEELTQFAKSKNLLVMEAMKFLMFPAFSELKEYIQAENLSAPLNLQASFGTAQTFNPEHHLYNEELCGGAAYDVAVYPLSLYSFWNNLYNGEHKLSQVSTSSPNHTKVDEKGTYIFEGTIPAKIEVSICEELPQDAIIKGSNYIITIKGKWWSPTQITIDREGTTKIINQPFHGDGFQFEATHFGQLIIDKQINSPLVPHQLTLEVLEWVEQIID